MAAAYMQECLRGQQRQSQGQGRGHSCKTKHRMKCKQNFTNAEATKHVHCHAVHQTAISVHVIQ